MERLAGLTWYDSLWLEVAFRLARKEMAPWLSVGGDGCSKNVQEKGWKKGKRTGSVSRPCWYGCIFLRGRLWGRDGVLESEF